MFYLQNPLKILCLRSSNNPTFQNHRYLRCFGMQDKEHENIVNSSMFHSFNMF